MVCSAEHDGAGGDTGSMAWCGWAAWPPRPVTLMWKSSEAARKEPARIAKSPSRGAGHVVHAVDLLDAEALHQPVVDHLAAAAAAFLGRLEDHHRGAVEVAGLGEVLRGAEQHRGVAVVAAGVHRAGGAARRRAGRSPRSSAARPCRRAGRRRGRSRCRGRGSPRRRRCGRCRSPPRRSRSRGACSATSALVRWVSKRISGWAWMSRRQAAISGARAAMRLMTGMGRGSFRRRGGGSAGGRRRCRRRAGPW